MASPHKFEVVPSTAKLLLSIREACTSLGIGRTTLYELISTGQIKCKKIGRRRMIPREALERFCKK